MASYLIEPVDRLPFGSAEKARRYATERYQGAVGRNWFTCDPSLRFLMRMYLGEAGLAWATSRLEALGAMMGGPIAERAEETDRNPPRLEKYDRWGRDISRVVMPPSFEEARRDLVASSLSRPEFFAEARQAGVDPAPMAVAWSYLLDQADIGMACALGTGGDMVVGLAELFAPPDIKERVRKIFEYGMFSGEAAQLLTERSGGSDLAALEATATRDGDAWRLNGFKWFASNAGASAFVVLAKPLGASDDARGIAPFLVLRERRDGSLNGIRIRRLKDKLGTRSVASAEIEFADAEAFLLAPATSASSGEGGDGKGLARMMELTNGARLGIAMMGLGCARRSLVEALCYARAREAFGSALIDKPLMRRKLASLVVEVEAVQALVFDGYLARPRLRLGAPLIKLRAARLGVMAASDAIEIHGGNGYIEQWPVARILRDAQVNPIWEGGDNILCLDVRRAMLKEDAHLPFLDRLRSAASQGPDDTPRALVESCIADLDKAITAWRGLDPVTAEARLFPLAQFMADVYAAALLLQQAGWERAELGTNRKALIARLYARDHLTDPGPLRGIDTPAEDLDHFDTLIAGTLTTD